MTKKYNLLVILISVTISAAIWVITLDKEHTKNKKHYTAKIYRGLSGWGYDIFVNNTLFIRQESVPATAGKDGFQKKEQAEQTASLIINKMKRGQLPSVTTFELEQILFSNKTQHGHTAKSK